MTIKNKKVLMHYLNIKSGISYFYKKTYYCQVFKILASNYLVFQNPFLLNIMYFDQVIFFKRSISYQVLGFLTSIAVI